MKERVNVHTSVKPNGRVAVPRQLVTEFLSAHHDKPFAGHLGVGKTLELVHRYFWWLNLAEDVRNVVAACPNCQVNKSSHQRPQGLLKPLQIPDSRWHTVTLDFITGLPRSQKGNDSVNRKRSSLFGQTFQDGAFGPLPQEVQCSRDVTPLIQ